MEAKNIAIKSDFEPIVDLIVLSYNKSEVSEKFLNHFLNNSPKEKIRIIWIDNGSADNSPQIVDKILNSQNSFDYIFLSLGANLGVIEGRNLGYNVGSKYNKKEPDYVIFLDNDQYVLDGWFEQHFSVLNCGYDMIGVEAWQIGRSMLPVLKLDNLNQCFNYVGCGGMLIKNEVIKKIGLFDKIFSPAYFEDPDINIRAYKSGFKIGWNFGARITHMAHKTLACKNSRQLFLKSYNNFKNKWKFNDLPRLVQKNLPQFSEKNQ